MLRCFQEMFGENLVDHTGQTVNTLDSLRGKRVALYIIDDTICLKARHYAATLHTFYANLLANGVEVVCIPAPSSEDLRPLSPFGKLEFMRLKKMQNAQSGESFLVDFVHRLKCCNNVLQTIGGCDASPITRRERRHRRDEVIRLARIIDEEEASFEETSGSVEPDTWHSPREECDDSNDRAATVQPTPTITLPPSRFMVPHTRDEEMENWFHLPESCRAAKSSAICAEFQVRTVPVLIVFDSNGEVITTDGWGKLLCDPVSFPAPQRTPGDQFPPHKNHLFFDAPKIMNGPMDPKAIDGTCLGA